MLTLFPLLNTNQYINKLKNDTVYPEASVNFSPVTKKNKWLEKGIQLTGFKAVVYAEYILVTFCFTIDC